MATTPDNSGVRFPPPLIFVVGLVAGYFLERKYPLTLLPRNLSIMAGFVLVIAGVAVAASGGKGIWRPA